MKQIQRVTSYVSLTVLLVITLPMATASAALPQYRAVDLGNLPGFPVTIPIDLNDRGEVIGDLFSNASPFIERPFYWSAQTGLQEFTLPSGGSGSGIFHIKNSGLIVGVSGDDDPNLSQVPFLWTQEDGFQSLHELANTSISDVSESGDLVGAFRQPPKIGHAFKWSETHGLLELPRTGHGPESMWIGPGFAAINELGVIAGGIRTSNGAEAALWTEDTGFIPIGKLPEHSLAGASEINNNRQVIGGGTFRLDGLGVSRSFFWSEDTGVVRLGNLPGNNYNRANDMDSLGRVVGSSISTRGGATRGFLWTLDDGMVELNLLLDSSSQDWFIRRAVAINEQGWILASGRNNNSVVRSVLMIPVPEPAGILLFGLGVAGLFSCRASRCYDV